MAKKRAQLENKKFTLGDIDKTLGQAQQHLEAADYKQAKRLVTNARNRLDIVRGIDTKGRNKRLTEAESFVQNVFVPTIEKMLKDKFPSRKYQKSDGEIWSYGMINVVLAISAKTRSGKPPTCSITYRLRLNGKAAKTQTDFPKAEQWYKNSLKNGWGVFQVNRKGELVLTKPKITGVTAGDVLELATDYCNLIAEIEKAL